MARLLLVLTQGLCSFLQLLMANWQGAGCISDACLVMCLIEQLRLTLALVQFAIARYTTLTWTPVEYYCLALPVANELEAGLVYNRPTENNGWNQVAQATPREGCWCHQPYMMSFRATGFQPTGIKLVRNNLCHDFIIKWIIQLNNLPLLEVPNNSMAGSFYGS